MRIAVGAMFSPEYADWFPGWLESVRGLNRQPDDVVVVTRGRVPKEVRKVTPPPGEFEYSAWRNAAAAACADADYFVSVDVDDRYLPHALDGCEDWSTDVVAYGLEYTDDNGTERRWVPTPDVELIAQGVNNHIPEGSPVRMDLWRRNPWDATYAPFADWAFWVMAARSGATFSATGRVDYAYRWHADTPTDETNVRALLRRL